MHKTQARRRRSKQNTKRICLWLLGCFPFGLALMWRKSCRWPKAVKCAVTACLALVVIAIVLPQTGPSHRSAGGVQLVGKEPTVEVYGPELPSALSESPVSYESVLHSAVSAPLPTPAPETYVYAAVGGKHYHTDKCRYYTSSSRKYTLYEAHFSGYTPCELCSPDVYGQ